MVSQDPSAGWDYRVYSGAVLAFSNGQNPFVLENVVQYVGGNLPFTYPPHTLYFFWVLNCIHIFDNIGMYYLLLSILLIASLSLITRIDSQPDVFFLVTLVLTGFMAVVWNFGTGNKDIFFLFLFALMFFLLMKEKYWQSSIVMGLTGAISLITGPFVALFLFVRQSWPRRILYILLSGVVVGILFLVGYLVNRGYFDSYIGTIQGGMSPLYDIGGYNTPTPYLLFGDLLKGLNITGQVPLAVVSCIYIGVIAYAAWNYYSRHSSDLLQVYSVITLAVFMLLPRIKPYDFIILAVPLYFLFRNRSIRMKCLMFAVISLPIFGWYLNFLIYPEDIPLYLGIYTQTYSLFLIFLVVMVTDYLKRSHRPAETTPS
jgi:hypothetical protein